MSRFGLVILRVLGVPAYLAHVVLVGRLLLTAWPLGVATLAFRLIGSYAWLYERVARRWEARLNAGTLRHAVLPRWIPAVTGLWGHLVWGALLLAIARTAGWCSALAVAATALVGERGLPLPARHVLRRIAARSAALAAAADHREQAARLGRLASEASAAAEALPLLAYSPRQ